jgi:hypothetical protein
MGGLKGAWARVAVWASALGLTSALALAVTVSCSSNKNGGATGFEDSAVPPEDTGTSTAEGGGPPSNEASTGGAMDAGSAPVPCDAALVLPADGAAAACSSCLKSNCMSDLAVCTDCTCISAIECAVTNLEQNIATTCPQYLSALGSGNAGVTAVSGCLAMKCNNPCHGVDGG